MIEVTYEMVDAAAQAFTTKPTEATYVVARRMIEAALKVHEANKPKPEPVAWAMCRFEHIFETKEWAEKYREDWNMRDEPITPIYTTPPTREPLSDDDIWRIYDEGDNVSSSLEFARSIEQAHGIGATNA